MLILEIQIMIIYMYIAFGIKFIFEKRIQQITAYLSKILQVKLKTTLMFFWKIPAQDM